MSMGTAHNLSSWITWVHVLTAIFLISQPPACQGEISEAELTSTSSSLMLSFLPNLAATNYTVFFNVRYSLFFEPVVFEPPYNGSRLVATYKKASPGFNYSVVVYENQTNKDSEVFSQFIATVPLSPLNVRVQDRGKDFLTVIWDSQHNINYTSHTIFFRKSNASAWKTTVGSDEESYVLDGLDAGVVYDIYVIAVSFDVTNDKESAPSLTISTSTLPAPPINLTAVAENTTHILVTWVPDASSFQEYFQVIYQAQEKNTSTSCQESPCSIVPGSPAGQEVVVFVSAVSHGFASSLEYVKTSTEPDQVRNLAADEGVRSLNLTWNVPQNAAITSFFVTVVNIPDNSTKEYTKAATPGATSAFFYLSSLIGGSVYKISVAAATPYTRGVPERNVFSTVPEPVSGLNGSALNTTAFTLSWKNPDNTLMDQVIISVFKPDNKIVRLEVDEDTTNQYVGDLVPGETYRVSIVVHTPQSQVVSEPRNLTIITKPVKPRLVSSLSAEESISLTIAREEDTGVFTSMEATLDLDTKKTTLSQGVISFPNLIPGTEYPLEMVTLSGGVKSDSVSLLLYTKPRPPQGVSIEAVNSSTLRVVWQAPDRGGYDNFSISVEESDGGSQQREMTTTELQAEFNDVTPGTTYNITVVTVKGDQRSSEAMDQNTTALSFDFDPESVAALKKVDATNGSITVNWTDPTKGDFNLYQLGIMNEEFNRSARPIFLPRSETNYTFVNLMSGRIYVVAIRTVLRLPSGRQRFGISVRLRALTKPLAVENLRTTNINTTAIQVLWSTNEDSSQDRFLISYETGSVLRKMEIAASNTSLEYSVPIGQLLSGTSYRVQVVAIRSISTDSEKSDYKLATGYTKPVVVSNFTLLRDGDSGNTVLVSWDPPATGGVDGYRVRYRSILRDPSSEFETNTLQSSTASKRLVDLFPGEKYEVQVLAVSHDLESEAVDSSVVLKPLPPTDLAENKDEIKIDSVTIEWTYDDSAFYCQRWRVAYRDEAGNGQQIDVALVKGQMSYSLLLPGLTPGQMYMVDVKSDSLNVSSDSKSLTVTARPVINSDLLEVTSTNSTFKFDYSVKDTDIFDEFLFSVTPAHIPDITRPKSENLHSVTLTGLNAGTRYELKAVTISNKVRSQHVKLEFITDPNPVPVALSAKATEITLSFGTLVGGAASYNVTCQSKSVPPVPCGSKFVIAGTPTVTFDGLAPFSFYQFTVVTLTEEVRGQTKQASQQHEQQTAEAAPSRVESLFVRAESIHSATLTWQQPLNLNGRLTNYIVAFRGQEPNFPTAQPHQDTRAIPATQTSVTFRTLRAGYAYTFQVFARTVENGPTREVQLTMDTLSPSFKLDVTPESSKPSLPTTGKDVTQSRISLQFTNPFSTESGFVRFFTVIVSRDPTVDDSSATLPSWFEAKNDKSILVYQAIAKCDSFFSSGSTCGKSGSARKKRAALGDYSNRTFVVGAQTETECAGQAFCNGPLLEGTAYFVKLRGFTESGLFEDTAYSERVATAESSSSSGGIVGGVIGAIAGVAVVAVVVIFVMKRKRRPKKATKHAGLTTNNWEQSTMNKFSRPVRLTQFPDHVRKMVADSDFKYAEEYEDLKEVGRDQPSLAAEFPPNRPKNRFTNILPYDHSRVKLLPTDDEEGSDYINANYMPGYNSKREYIATQGPLPATRDDFWRMLWEQGCRNIVMLTRCQEKGREKSDHYWPSDSEPKFYGDLQVVILNETHMPDWTIIEFRVALGDVSRQVRHFHYRSWPDFGVPKDPTSIIRFVRTVRDKLIREAAPLILHCSAGVGRTGTFIVLDHLLQLIREQDEVDIFGIVYKLRKERVLMVQTEQQYKFIHECLLCVLENREQDTTYANVGQVNIGFDDDEGINLEGP